MSPNCSVEKELCHTGTAWRCLTVYCCVLFPLTVDSQGGAPGSQLVVTCTYICMNEFSYHAYLFFTCLSGVTTEEQEEQTHKKTPLRFLSSFAVVRFSWGPQGAPAGIDCCESTPQPSARRGQRLDPIAWLRMYVQGARSECHRTTAVLSFACFPNTKMRTRTCDRVKIRYSNKYKFVQ